MHFFEPAYAKKYGVNAAIILQNIIYWTEKKQANNQCADDGLYYIYNSVAAWQELFPYLTASAIRTALKKLESAALIVSRKDLNKAGYDKTKHYAISLKALPLLICQKSQMDLSKIANGFVKNDKPIPDINTDNKPDSKLYIDEVSFDEFWAIYPNKQGKAKSQQLWSKLKVSSELFSQIKNHIGIAYANTEKRFIPHGSTYLSQRRWEDTVDAANQPKVNADYIPTDYTANQGSGF